MKRWIALSCVFALFLGMLASCGAAEPSMDTASASQTEPTMEPETESAEPEPSAASEPISLESPEEPEEPEQTPEPEPVVIEYPFQEHKVFSVFCPADSMAFMLMSVMGLGEDWNNVPTLSYVYETTNAEFTFNTPSEAGASEQFNLMIASGDITDLFDSSRYTGGSTQALSDDVILDLTEMIPEHAPDYWALLNKQPPLDQANAYNDDQQILSINDISAFTERTSGLLMRKDMLEGLGMNTPKTPESLHEVLAAGHSAYGTDQTMFVGQNGILNNVVGAFGCPGFDLSTYSADPGFYVENGMVKASLVEDSYYGYLQYFISLYNEGILMQDFYSAVVTAASMDALSLGSAMIWSADGGLIDSMTATGRQQIEGYELCGIGSIVANEGDTYTFAAPLSTVDTEGTCVSATCQDPEGALELLNWFFTEQGRTFCTWGVEDLTYTAENGENSFTAEVTDGFFPINLMYGFYVWSPCAMYRDKRVLYGQYSENMLSAYSLWGQDTADSSIPAGLSLTVQESEQYTGLIGDIVTYASEEILRFILGEQNLTEESWHSFGDTLRTMGLDDCIGIYQTAYDRYLSRVE